MKVRVYRMNRRKEASYKISGWARLGILYFLGLVAVTFALMMTQGLTPLHFLVIPGAILFSNIAEYFFHKFPMHQAPTFLPSFYKQHSGVHHRYFTHKFMETKDPMDLNEALTNSKVTAMLFAFIIVPLSLALSFFGANIGLLTFVGLTGYFIFYEFTHLVTHLPSTNLLTKLPYFKGACERHRVHHNTKLMHKWNFNVSFPLMDKVFGTIYSNK